MTVLFCVWVHVRAVNFYQLDIIPKLGKEQVLAGLQTCYCQQMHLCVGCELYKGSRKQKRA